MKTPARGRSGSPRNRTGKPGDTSGRPRREDFRQGRLHRGQSDGRTVAAEQPERRPRPARKREPMMQIHGDLLYGRNAVRESLRAGRRTHKRLLVAEGVREDERVSEILSLARERGAILDHVPRMLLDDLTRGANHQGIGLEAGDFPYVDLEDVIEADGTILVMDHLNDPQNFGTLMRAADASGVAGVVIPQDRSVSVSPAVVNSSAGAVEHLRIALTPNLARALDKIEASERWIIGLDEDETDTNIFTTDIPTPVGVVLGAEGSGLTPIVRKRCQVIISLPMRGHVDSLNAATAGSIVLYDLLRREQSQTQD